LNREFIGDFLRFSVNYMSSYSLDDFAILVFIAVMCEHCP